MEEAYRELYQEFLRLRSLCMKQAALLHEITTALQNQQGNVVSNGDLGAMVSIPIQCTHQICAPLHEHSQSSASSNHSATAQHGFHDLSNKMGVFSDVLTEDMSKLGVAVHHQRKDDERRSLSTLNTSRQNRASFCVSKSPAPSHDLRGGETPQTARMAVVDRPSPLGDVLSQSDRPFMSDVALQSHVCEFCQAVFPGDSTTKGEFLQHLCTHVN
ncbi:uncharacterized protein zgc:113184 [Thalassophryne amazonica]|uniref:uncharacterized protein zgc:113184 n=1 Tax=Thalassophryne amazonica TaxID=390379 RepID=UPI0014726AF7|nr:uncharacterized protein zgc:113184 [Thalassophryne amazonica]XP_034022764.1 uncharacterized protein zgc:113184 [Thalassophryne amazonica]XP_034022766.1 uncharacterized protein zgc:113184 [Thalassophryne amazonica]